jgi:site-specific recombinase XerD
MAPRPDFPAVCQRFFGTYLLSDRVVSPATISTYAQAFRVFLKYAESETGKCPDQLTIADLDAEFVARFLRHLEQERGNCALTINGRLAAIKSFFRYVSRECPGSCEVAQRVLALPPHRGRQRTIPFLTKDELNALLSTVNQDTWIGRRDYALILLAAETGLRNSELTGLCWKDITLSPFPTVSCIGKGSKARTTPLPPRSVSHLERWRDNQTANLNAIVFPNAGGGRLSADSFQYAARKYANLACKSCASLRGKRITPHVFRHTCAMTLLDAGVDILTVSRWLGHENVSTTAKYLKVSLERKRKALISFSGPGPIVSSGTKIGAEMLTFLKAICTKGGAQIS